MEVRDMVSLLAKWICSIAAMDAMYENHLINTKFKTRAFQLLADLIDYTNRLQKYETKMKQEL